MLVQKLAPDCDYFEWLKTVFFEHHHCDSIHRAIVDLVPEQEMTDFIYHFFSHTRVDWLANHIRKGSFPSHQEKFIRDIAALQQSLYGYSELPTSAPFPN